MTIDHPKRQVDEASSTLCVLPELGILEMTLSEWAALAEIVGAIAVVVTLLYLAVQIKHSKESLDANTKAIRGQAISDVTRNVHDQMHMLIQGHDVAAAFQKFATEDQLEPTDAFLLDSVLSAVFVARQNEFFQWKQGLLDDDVFKSLHHVILTCLGSPNGQHWWDNEGRRMFTPDFVGLWARFVAKAPPTRLKPERELFD